MLLIGRRDFLSAAAIAGGQLALTGAAPRGLFAQGPAATRSVDTPVLSIAYAESGDTRGFPIVLLHGFPDDAHAWDEVAPPLAGAGYRVLAPYLRGYGATRFRDAAAPRMAEQAAIGQDLIDFADALGLRQFAVAGYDWGGRAAAIAAALHPDRVRATVLIGGYTIQNTLAPPQPGPPAAEHRAWYQWYFNTERGRAGLEQDRRGLCEFLWRLWSPTWDFDDATFERTAVSFDNPDFVDVVIHSYRHRRLNASGDPALEPIEERLAAKPTIAAPTIAIDGADDTVDPPPADDHDASQFTGPYERRLILGAGHLLPHEAPDAIVAAVEALLARA
jgi:pimeloyl-ACP methyl ester carboxylesterase